MPQSGPSTPSRAPPLSVGPRDDPAMIRDMLLANRDQLALLQQNNPSLADAVLSGSLGKSSGFFIRNVKYKINIP